MSLKCCDPYCQKEAFQDTGVLTKYNQIEPSYLPQSVITYIYLYPVYGVGYISKGLFRCK
jgi:hypothetical protein